MTPVFTSGEKFLPAICSNKRSIIGKLTPAFAPEVFSINNQLFAQRLYLRSDLQVTSGKVSYNGGFRHIRQSYNVANSDEISTRLSEANGGLSYQINQKRRLKMTAAYVYRDVDSETPNQLSTIIGGINLMNALSKFTWLGIGFNLERFAVDGEWLARDTGNRESVSNDGNRLGPRISLDYRGKYLLSLQYALQFQRSNSNNITEHHWRLFYARTIARNTSLLFLFDRYVQRGLENSDEQLAAAYTPLQSEDQAYLKLVYNLEPGRSLNTRLAWFRNNIPQVSGDFNGLLLTIGLKLEF